MWGERLGDRERALDGVERVLHVDHDRELRTDRPPNGRRDLNDLLVGAVQALVDVRPRERRLALDRAEAELLRAHAPRDHRLDIGVVRRHLRLERGVRRQ